MGADTRGLRSGIGTRKGLSFPLSGSEAEALCAETAHDRAILQECNDTLFALIRERAPHLERLFGPKLWEYIHICIAGELGVEKPPEWGQEIARLSPDNPILRLAENIFYIP